MNIRFKNSSLLIVLTFSFLINGCSKKKESSSGNTGHNKQKADAKKEVSDSHDHSSGYICPMHPQITSDQTGACPICGMDLIPMGDYMKEFGDSASSEDDSKHEGHSPTDKKPDDRAKVKITLERQQLIGVKEASVEKRNLFREITAPGRVAFDPELYTAQSEYLESLRQWAAVKNSPLEAARRNAREMIQSSKIRLQVLGLSEDQIKALARRGRQSESLILSGKGEDSWIYADVFEQELTSIKSGLPVEISASFLQGKKLFGEVSSVDEVINPQTRTAKLRIKVNSKSTKLRPESFVNVSIFAPLGEQKAIPKSAVLDTGKETFVFVKISEGEFEPRNVTILKEGDNFFAVGEELKEGEVVVEGANFLIDSESRLKAVIMNAGKAKSGHNH